MGNRERESAAAASVPRAWWLAIVAGLLILPGFFLVDHGVATSLRSWQWAPFLELMRGITWLGYGALDLGIPVVLALVAWWGEDGDLRTRGLWGAATVIAAGVLDQILKNISCRARPTAPGAGTFFAEFPCFLAPHAYASFPSGHATTVFALAVVLALWYPRWRSLFLGLAILVGLSRVVLGAHFPSDVLAGALLGSGVALAIHAYVPAVRGGERAARAAFR